MTIDALNSIWHQTYRPIEVLLVDDGSPSDLKGPIEDWKSQTIKGEGFSARYIRQENSGAPTARNYGVTQASGEFIQFLDNDDFIHSEKIEKQVAMLRRCEDKIAVYAESQIIYDNKGHLTLRKLRKPRTEHTLFNWLSGEAVHSHSLLWRRQDICSLGPWQENLTANQDGEYAMRFLMDGGRLLYCPNTIVYYRYQVGGPRSISKSASHTANQSRFSVIENVEQRLVSSNNLAPYTDELAKQYLRMAPKFASNSPKLAQACLDKARHLSPTLTISSTLPKHYAWVYRIFGMPRGDNLLQLAQRWKHRYLSRWLAGYTPIDSASTLYGSAVKET